MIIYLIQLNGAISLLSVNINVNPVSSILSPEWIIFNILIHVNSVLISTTIIPAIKIQSIIDAQTGWVTVRVDIKIESISIVPLDTIFSPVDNPDISETIGTVTNDTTYIAKSIYRLYFGWFSFSKKIL